MSEEMNTTGEVGSDKLETGSEMEEVKEPDSGLLGKVRELLGLAKGEKLDSEPNKAEENPGAGTDKPKKEDAKDEKQSEKQENVKYNQADFEAAIKKAREDVMAEQEEEKRRAKLTPEEQASEEQAQMKRQNEELTGKIQRMELEQKAAQALIEKKLPTGLSGFLDYTDEVKMNASLEKLGKMYQADLEAGINERLKGKTPKGLGGAANLTDGLISSEIAKRIRGGL